MPSRGSSTRNPKLSLTKLTTIPEQLFQLPPELDWKRTFLDQKANHSQYFRSKSAPAAVRMVPSQRATISVHDLNCSADIGGSVSEKPCDPRVEDASSEDASSEDASSEDSSVDSFRVGDTVAATSDFRIGGELAVEKGCKGIVMCHGERPDGSMGICVQFRKWKNGRAATVLCQPAEIHVVAKAPSAENFGIGETVSITSDFCIDGVVVVEKGCRGKVMSHGEMPDGSKGVCIEFEARKDGSDAYVLCQPHQIQIVYRPSRTKSHAQTMREYISFLEDHLEHAWARICSVISLMEELLFSGSQLMLGNFANRSFSSGSWVRTSILLGIVAAGSCAYWMGSVPFSEKVIVEDTEVYSWMVGSSQLNKCVAFKHKYLKTGSKKNITVCGTQTKAILYLRNKCEAYAHYQHEIGSCNATDEFLAEASNTCVTASPATENGVRWHGQAQSYMIKWCSPSIGIWDAKVFWQRMLRTFGFHTATPNEK